MGSEHKLKILFLCTGNSCRSQMAEAWTRHLKGELIEAYSAGTEPKGMDPRAVQAMAEKGIDISQQRSKSVTELGDIEFDYVILPRKSSRHPSRVRRSAGAGAGGIH
jgi:arsenate reductase